MVVADQNFAQIHGAALGRNRPQDVRQILIAKSRRFLQIAKFHFNFGIALLALYFGLAVRRRHKVRAREIQLRSSAAVLIVDRLHAAANDGHTGNVGVGLMGSTVSVV